MKTLIASLVAAVLPIVILTGIALWRGKDKRKRVKTPLTSKLLRPPGESLRQELVRLNEEFDQRLITFLGICVAIGIGIWLGPRKWGMVDVIALGIVLLLPYILCGFLAVRIFQIVRVRSDYELGFLGERAVGEELNQIMAKGYAVFHDVQFQGAPGSKNFNIDHVAVGPSGVFAVETKTRRKQAMKRATNVVIYDGCKLTFPWGSDDFGIDQARRNAGVLGAWLEKAVGTKIEVKPILALPGWKVERKGRGDVTVVSGREICSAFPNEGSKEVLSAPQIKLIRFHLDERCRNVEVE